MILDYYNMEFSIHSSQQLISLAKGGLSSEVVESIICFSPYLLGTGRKTLSSSVNIPCDIIKSLIKGVLRDGFAHLMIDVINLFSPSHLARK